MAGSPRTTSTGSWRPGSNGRRSCGGNARDTKDREGGTLQFDRTAWTAFVGYAKRH
ncbi:DUF397 domain-containing protein [Micromonospora wenchangensis]|uniref:DUF397 domain-containing protein n=1 Tax=Micromonospora wenchangensis TaxID=1185415 RepID=UPI0033D9481B